MFNQVLEVSPSDPGALNGKGLTLLKLGREEEARRVDALVQQTRQSPGTGSGHGFFRPTYSTPPSASSYTSGKYLHQEEKNPLVAAFCSVMIPGLGQVYNGEPWKGTIIFALTLIGIVFFLIPGLMVWMYGAFTAYTVAGKMNAGTYPSRPTSHREMLLFVVAAIIMIILAIMVALYFLSVLLYGIAETWFPNPFEASGIPR